MKTIYERAQEFAKEAGYDPDLGRGDVLAHQYRKNVEKLQEFIPVEEEKPPYGEDILVQTPAGSIYFGKMHEGMNGKPDYFWPDMTEPEEILKIQQIKSWRPIFYK